MARLNTRIHLCCWLLFSFVFWQKTESRANVTDADLKSYGTASLDVEDAQPYTPQTYAILWRGKPTLIKLRVAVGIEIPYQDGRLGSARPDIPGIKVRLRAFDGKSREVGQINGPGKQDDSFLTGQPCRFTPPRAGTYRLALEVVGGNGVFIPVRRANYPSSHLTKTQQIKLTVYPVVQPQIEIDYSDWVEKPEKSNIYQRKISLRWINSDDFRRSRRRSDSDEFTLQASNLKSLDVKLAITPLFSLKNLGRDPLAKITWLSAAQVSVPPSGFAEDVATQYFRYEPTRDTRRDPGLYEVKALPTGTRKFRP